MIFHSYDIWSLPAVFFGIIFILFISAEVGFSIGKIRSKRLKDANSEDKQAGAIMGASLGLLAFLLAFTFSMASSIHSERKSLVLEESNAIGTLYLRTQMLESPGAQQLRELISEYVDVRVKGGNWRTGRDLSEGIKKSEELLARLWPITLQTVKDGSITPLSSLVIVAANDVIDVHAKRLNAGHKRLPEIVGITLFVIAMMTLGLMGYQSGLNGVRVLVPRAALILSLASVMLLVVDLDRPGGTLINVSQQTMEDLQKQIKEDNL